MDTIVTTPALQFETVACLMRQLSQFGVTQEHLLNALESPGTVRAVAEALIVAPKPPKRLNAEACRKLIDYLLPKKIDEDDRCRSNDRSDALFGEERDWLSEPVQVELLLRELPPVLLKVTVMRSGLDGKPALTAQEVGDHLGISAGKVNKFRGEAASCLRLRALQLVHHTRRTGRLSL